MISRSITARLMAPLAMSMLMLCVLAGLVFAGQTYVAAANSAALNAEANVNALSELRSTSRSLQRDALNLITEGDPKERATIVQKFNTRIEKMAKGLAALESMPDHNFVPQAFFPTQHAVIDALKATADKATTGDTAGALDDFHHNVRPAERAASKIADTRMEALEHEVADLRLSAERASFTAQLLLFLITAVMTVAGTFAGWVITRRGVVIPLLDLKVAMESLAAGDTDLALPYIGRADEVGQMAQSMATFRDQLSVAEQAKQAQADLIVSSVGEALGALASGDLSARISADLTGSFAKLKSDFNNAMMAMSGAMKSVNQCSSGINGGAAEIRQASDDLANRTEQQAANLEEASAALSEVTQGLRQTADGAGAAHAAISMAETQTTEGQTVVSQAVDAMADIERSAEEIAQIITVIDAISFQTNLLALNAGVEAARAGDAGKGFAVVANEVRALAQRSADAAADIKRLIQSSGDQVHRGVQLVGRSGDVFGQIAGQVAQVAGLVGQISSLSSQQANNLLHINSTVHAMDLTTQQNAAMVEEATAAARSLAEEAKRLDDLVGGFRLDAGESMGPVAYMAEPQRRWA